MRIQYWKSDVGGDFGELTNGVAGSVLFFPFAGAHRNSYRVLQEELSARRVASDALELPGHGARIGEPCCISIEEMVEDLLPVVRGAIIGTTGHSSGAPTILLGHSMGALIATRIVQRCRQEGLLPDALVLSGRAGPGRGHSQYIHLLPRAEFVQVVLGYGGSPREVLEDPDMLDLIEPPLRADFRAVETHDLGVSESVEIPVYVLFGSNDKVGPEDAAAWRSLAGTHFEVIEQQGGHFHLLERPAETAAIIARIIESIRLSKIEYRGHSNHQEFRKVDR